MRDHYDFSKGERGKFYRGDQPFSVTIEVDNPGEIGQYQVFSTEPGIFKFRLVLNEKTLLISDSTYRTKEACIEAINTIKHASLLATTQS